MRISFTGWTNKKYVMINTAIFKILGGSEIVVDRDETEYKIDDDGSLNMTWKNCYLWSVDDKKIFGQDGMIVADYKTIKEIKELIGPANATLKMELEDDADEDYEVTIDSWSIS